MYNVKGNKSFLNCNARAWKELQLNAEIALDSGETEGWLEVKLVNDNDEYIWFDDLSISRYRRDSAEIIQEDQYDPLGQLLTDLSYRKANETENKSLYNAGSEWQQDLQWYGTFYRQYDPQLGRFHQQDPAADLYHSLTPYQYAANSPVVYNDPMGDRLPAPKQRPICDECGNGGGGGGGGFRNMSFGNPFSRGPMYANLPGFGMNPNGMGVTINNAHYQHQAELAALTDGKSGDFSGMMIRGQSVNSQLSYISYLVPAGHRSSEGEYGTETELLFKRKKTYIMPQDGDISGGWKFLNDYNSIVLNTAGSFYGAIDLALNHSHQSRINIANKLSSVLGESAGLHNKVLKQVGGTISKTGNILGGIGLGISLANLGYQSYIGKDNTALWIDTAISTTLFLGSVIPNPLQPIFIGAGIVYAGVRIGAGEQIDNKINSHIGFR